MKMIKIANWVGYVLRGVFLTLVYYCMDGAAFFISPRAYRKKSMFGNGSICNFDLLEAMSRTRPLTSRSPTLLFIMQHK